MAFEILNDTTVTPARLYTMVRLVSLLQQPKRKELFDLVQPIDVLPHDTKQDIASNVFTAALSCGLVSEVKNIVSLQISPHDVETMTSFRRCLQRSCLGIVDDSANNFLLNIYTAWYAAQDERVFQMTAKDFEIRFNEDIFPSSDKRSFNTTKFRGWKLWAAFLGHGWMMKDKLLLMPDARIRIEPLLPRLLPEGQSSVRMSTFMEQVATLCPELDGGRLFERCAQVTKNALLPGNRISLMLSNALRGLDESGRIQLSLQADALETWRLFPAAGHRHQQISHIQLGRLA